MSHLGTWVLDQMGESGGGGAARGTVRWVSQWGTAPLGGCWTRWVSRGGNGTVGWVLVQMGESIGRVSQERRMVNKWDK